MHHELELYESKGLVNLDPKGMLKSWMPKAVASIENIGGRSQTNYMDARMVVGEKRTKLGQARQCLAEIASLRGAILENEFDLTNVHVRGAVKRCVQFLEIYKRICKELGVSEITDEMIEAGQPEEHLKTMFMQALRAACASGGYVDEGDLQYANNVGVSVSECQLEVTEFLMENGKIRLFSMAEQNEWLEEMWVKYGKKN